MTNPSTLAELLAHAVMTREEKEAWAKLVPLMNESERERLADSLRRQDTALTALRREYETKHDVD